MSRFIAGILVSLSLGVGQAAASTPVTERPWQEAVVSVTNLDVTARFFREIGSYDTVWRGPLAADLIAAWGLPAAATGEALLLRSGDSDRGWVRLVRFDTALRQEPMRPGARAWDTGCYFSLMVRMKDMQAVYDDAIRLGWWTETPITDLQFGASKLKVVVYRGPDGLQVQGYERLSPPLPEVIGPFERLTRPFNVMQMVRNRDVSYEFFSEGLGFATFYNGEPYLAKEPEYMPLGIPYNLTTEIPYRAGIVHPVPGEFGRMEMIDISGLDGRDHSGRCVAPNLGILAVRFEVDSVRDARRDLEARGLSPTEVTTANLAPYGAVGLFQVLTPDGAIIQFYSAADS